MHIKENIKMAFRGLLNNKMRAVLTMLGVIIGISSVTLILALGQGGKAKMMSQLEAIGTNSVSISVNSSNTQNLITDKDISVLKEK
ncbi:MAG: ABC transporter permease, partial [Clostridia bacterium]